MVFKNKKILAVVFICLLPILLTLLSYKTMVYGADLNPEQQSVMNFLNSKGSLSTEFTANERSHLVDVKILMGKANYFFYLCLLVITLMMTYFFKRNNEIRTYLQPMFFYGGIATLSFVILIIVSSIVNFNFTFNLFHLIFFPQGNWQFAADSLIIQTFPIEFFINLSRNIFGFTAILGIVFIGLSIYIKHDLKSKRN